MSDCIFMQKQNPCDVTIGTSTSCGISREWRGRAERKKKTRNQELNLKLSFLVTGEIQFLPFKPHCLKKHT